MLSKKICLIDSCILIDVFHDMTLKKIFSTLKFEGYTLILPKLVETEVVNNNKKEQKRLNKLKDRYQIDICPITNSKRELSELPIDIGEADAYMQVVKASKYDKVRREILFVTNDKKAISFFKNSGIEAKTLNDVIKRI